MVYYLIRHKATGEYMPQLERGRGYSHWNPAVIKTTEVFRPRKLIGVPRLLASRRTAARCIANWNAYPNSYASYRTGFDGDQDMDIKAEDDNRKKEDLEIVEMELVDIRLTADKAFVAGYHTLWHKDTKTYTFSSELSPGDPLGAFIAWLKEIGYVQGS